MRTEGSESASSVTAFSWLYGTDPDGVTCTCGVRINPRIKRRFWCALVQGYVNTPAEECDTCATARRAAEAISLSQSR